MLTFFHSFLTSLFFRLVPCLAALVLRCCLGTSVIHSVEVETWFYHNWTGHRYQSYSFSIQRTKFCSYPCADVGILTSRHMCRNRNTAHCSTQTPARLVRVVANHSQQRDDSINRTSTELQQCKMLNESCRIEKNMWKNAKKRRRRKNSKRFCTNYVSLELLGRSVV